MNSVKSLKIMHLGFNSFQLKVIAVFFMTIDHIASYLTNIEIIFRFSAIFHTLGRIAAPIFLFVLISSVKHTKSVKRLLTRLYFAGAVTGLFSCLFSFIFANSIGVYFSGNIFFTYFYTVLSIYILQMFICTFKKFQSKNLIIAIICLFITLAIPVIWFFIDRYRFFGKTINIKGVLLPILQIALTSIIPNILYVEYSVAFILLGILWYFFQSRLQQCMIFLTFCIISRIASIPEIYSYLNLLTMFADNLQWLMVLATPFLYFYNEEKGKNSKWFFYLYYPLNKYVLIIINYLFQSR